MPTIKEIRQKYPQYKDMPDNQLADALHAKYYSDMPKEEYYQKISYNPNVVTPEFRKQAMEQMMLGQNRPGSPMDLLSQGRFKDVYNELTGNPKYSIPLEIGTAILAPEIKGAQLLGSGGKIAAETLKQAGIGALFNPENREEAAGISGATTIPFAAASEAIMSQSPTIRTLGRLLRGVGTGAIGAEAGYQAGGTTGATIGAGLAGALGVRLGAKGALREAAREIQKAESPASNELTKYAQELGLKYLTPAEATGNQALAAMQGRVARDVEGSKKLYTEGGKRIQSEKDAFNNLLDVIYNPSKLEGIKNIKYEQAFKQKVPDQFLDKWLDNEVVQQAITKANRQPIYKERLKGVEPQSVEYWDNIREILLNLESSYPPGSPIANRYNELRNKVIGEIDETIPSYQEGRKLAELKNTRKDLENAFDDAKIRGSEISKFLLKDKKYDKLMMNLRNNPEAQELVSKWRDVTKNLINPVTPKTAAGYATTGMYESRNTKDASKLIADKLGEFFSGKPDSVALAELITNPNWSQEVNKILQLTEREKLFSKALKKVPGAAYGVARAIDDQMKGD